MPYYANLSIGVALTPASPMGRGAYVLTFGLHLGRGATVFSSLFYRLYARAAKVTFAYRAFGALNLKSFARITGEDCAFV